MSRLCKLTEDRAKKIIYAIRNNVPHQIAAPAVGLSEKTLEEWLAKGKKDLLNDIDSKFARFTLAVRQAELEKVVDHMQAIETMQKGWQARAWILTRRYAKYFGEHAFQIEELEAKVKVLENMLSSQNKHLIEHDTVQEVVPIANKTD